ncbi:T9SS type A sorting domain-containing protein [Parasediminibacterium sp. JCM 36343]|uniref:T9SS type A sorting domain-containing protein n=1 Tax=Parasediminibacterium sp. JCM 36343 TaxID=3374279 RepID=UPI00397BD60F
MALYDNDTLLNLPLALQKASFDSIVLTAQWKNPSIGKHALVAHLLDSTVWDFPSSPVAFTISAPLPVTITHFNASPSGCGAIVLWDVADETNVQTYQLQQSDAAGIFTTMKTILAANNGSNNSYTTQVPQTTTTAYYRLLLQTNTGQQLYSQTAKVQTDCSEKETLALLPNPSQKGRSASLSYKNVASASIQSAIAIYDAAGKMVYQQPVSWQKGDNQYKLPTLPTGMYIIKLLHNGMAVKWQVL